MLLEKLPDDALLRIFTFLLLDPRIKITAAFRLSRASHRLHFLLHGPVGDYLWLKVYARYFDHKAVVRRGSTAPWPIKGGGSENGDDPHSGGTLHHVSGRRWLVLLRIRKSLISWFPGWYKRQCRIAVPEPPPPPPSSLAAASSAHSSAHSSALPLRTQSRQSIAPAPSPPPWMVDLAAALQVFWEMCTEDDGGNCTVLLAACVPDAAKWVLSWARPKLMSQEDAGSVIVEFEPINPLAVYGTRSNSQCNKHHRVWTDAEYRARLRRLALCLLSYFVSIDTSIAGELPASVVTDLRFDIYGHPAPDAEAAHSVIILSAHRAWLDKGCPTVHHSDHIAGSVWQSLMGPYSVPPENWSAPAWTVPFANGALRAARTLPVLKPDSRWFDACFLRPGFPQATAFKAGKLAGSWIGYCIFIKSDDGDQMQPNWYWFEKTEAKTEDDALKTPGYRSPTYLETYTGHGYNVMGESQLENACIMHNSPSMLGSAHSLVQLIKQYQGMPFRLRYSWVWMPGGWLVGIGKNIERERLRLGIWVWPDRETCGGGMF